MLALTAATPVLHGPAISPHLSPSLPLSPHISPYLHISPHLPTSPHISPHLPISPPPVLRGPASPDIDRDGQLSDGQLPRQTVDSCCARRVGAAAPTSTPPGAQKKKGTDRGRSLLGRLAPARTPNARARGSKGRVCCFRPPRRHGRSVGDRRCVGRRPPAVQSSLCSLGRD